MLKKSLIRIKILIVFSIVISCENQKQNLKLPSIFSDNMVLQQKTNVSFWGFSNSKETITINPSWGKSKCVISNNEGEWELKIKTPEAGGPYKIEVKSENQTVTYNDVLIGEVWIASGQSNMGMRLSDGIENQDEEIKNANYNDIRFFSVLEDLTGNSIKNQNWLKTTPENAEKYSAAAYFFARKLHNELDVPIGIISSSWGGTKVESWISNKKLKQFKDLINKNLPKNTEQKLIDIERVRYNDSIANLNKSKLGISTFNLPEPYFLWNENMVWNIDLWEKYRYDWTELDLNDFEFKNSHYDDSLWDFVPKSFNKSNSLKLNNIFQAKENTISSGIIWFRTKVLVDNLNTDYSFYLEKGIDHIDQTFFNGQLIGNTFSIDGKRNYTIPKNLLKIGENSIAIRITNLGGDGGFNSPVIIKNNSSSDTISFENFKFKHHAFITNGSSVLVHNYPFNELVQDYDIIEKKLYRGYVINSPYGNSISFEKMLRPVIPYTIKGAIWYQGESNVENYNEYQELFSGMIEDWREIWGYNFPFYYTQIAPAIYGENHLSHHLRDSQRKTLEFTSNTGMAILMDIGEKDNVHAKNKQDVGKRLALLALKNDYNFDIVPSGPLYKSHVNYNNYIVIDFDYKGSGLCLKGDSEDFEIAGIDEVFYNASAKIIGDKLIVSSKCVNNPKHVRYGWKNWVVGSLFNKEGLPASSFNSLN